MLALIQGRRLRGACSAAFLLLSVSVVFTGRPCRAQSPPDEQKIDGIIRKLTLEEKIQMLSGSSMMASTGVARLGIPAFRIENKEHIEDAIDDLLLSSGPMMAHVVIDQKANVWPIVGPGKTNSEMMDEIRQ